MADLAAFSALVQFWDLGFHLLKVKSKPRKICILQSIFFAKQELITCVRLQVQDFTTDKNFSLISAISKSFEFLLGKVNL